MLWNLIKTRLEVRDLIVYGAASRFWDQAAREPYRTVGCSVRSRVSDSLQKRYRNPFLGIWEVETIVGKHVTTLLNEAVSSRTRTHVLKVFRDA